MLGHRGWSHDPDSTARYALAVSFEILGQEISIYEPLRSALEELQQEVETLAGALAEIENEAEVQEE